MWGKQAPGVCAAVAVAALGALVPGTASASSHHAPPSAAASVKVGETDLAGLDVEHVPGRRDMVVYLKAKHSGKCMTVYRGSKAKGAKVNQYRCVGAKNQWWVLYAVAPPFWRIAGYESGKCLSVAGASKKNGAALIQWDCNGAADQRFKWNGHSALKAVHSGKCLDVQGGSKADNAPIVQWSCNGRGNQTWNRVD